MAIDSVVVFFFFFFKQKTAYEMRISDWSSDVCSSDLIPAPPQEQPVLITGATIHIGYGEVMEQGALLFRNGKIVAVGTAGTVTAASDRSATGVSNTPGSDKTSELWAVEAEGKHG